VEEERKEFRSVARAFAVGRMDSSQPHPLLCATSIILIHVYMYTTRLTFGGLWKKRLHAYLRRVERGGCLHPHCTQSVIYIYLYIYIYVFMYTTIYIFIYAEEERKQFRTAARAFATDRANLSQPPFVMRNYF